MTTPFKEIPELRFIFARNIRKARKDASLSQMDLAKIVRRHQSFISGVEKGDYPIQIDDMERLSRALDIPLKDLVSL